MEQQPQVGQIVFAKVRMALDESGERESRFMCMAGDELEVVEHDKDTCWDLWVKKVNGDEPKFLCSSRGVSETNNKEGK